MNPKLLAVAVCVFLVEGTNALHLLREYGAVAVYYIDAVNRGLAYHVQGNLYVSFLCRADCHYVAAYFVALVFCVFYNFQCTGNLVNVAGNADKVYGAFASGADVFLKITAANVCHYRKLYLFFRIVTDYVKYVFVVAEFPLAEF